MTLTEAPAPAPPTDRPASGRDHATRGPRFGRVRAALRQPLVWLGLLVVAILAVLVLAPLSGLVATTLRGEGLQAWRDVLASPMSGNLFWGPLRNSLLVGLITAVGSTLLGGGLAWLVVMTDVPYKKTIGLLASIPFAIPTFTLALAWETVFRNDRVGGRVGGLQSLGMSVPDWLAWGPVPVSIVLIGHYYALSFLLISAALAGVNGDLMEAGEMAGASRARVAVSIALPVVTPAVVSAALLAFAEGISNFAAPALLGLPVRFQTLSTRLYGAISTGQVERGYVLSILLIICAALILVASTKVVGTRRAFTTITGKGARRHPVRLGGARRPAAAVGIFLVSVTTVIPLLILLLSSFTLRTNSLSGGLSVHFWIGESDPSLAQGQRGVLRNPQVVDAAVSTITLGLCVAVGAGLLGLAVGYVVSRLRQARVITSAISVLAFLPFLIPGIGFGAAYIAQFGTSIGPIPALYGTFTILVLAGAAYTLPYAAQAGRAGVGQISTDLEESATMAGAGLLRRIGRVVVPLASRGLIAGGVLAFVKIVSDLSLVVLLVTPSTPLLSVLTYRYAAEGFGQFANAITVIIAVIAIAATVLARRLQGRAQPWVEE